MKSFSIASLPALILVITGILSADRLTEFFASLHSDFPSPATGTLTETISTHHQGSMPVASLDTIPKVFADHKTQKTKPASKMWCSSNTIYKNEVLELHFATPNAPFMGIIDPSGHFFYLIYPAESAAGALTPLVESEQFIAMNSLKINTGSLLADPYTFEVYTNQKVFTQSGTYTFVLGDNLHVDDSDGLAKILVNYIHTNRPARVSVDTLKLVQQDSTTYLQGYQNVFSSFVCRKKA